MSGLTQAVGLKALGGQKSGRNAILCPGPGHGKRDMSLSVAFDPKYPEGFAVHSFAGDDWRECRDYVRSKLGLSEWTPEARKEQPVFKAREFVYLDAKGDEHHRVDALSDGSFRHYHYDLDGWVKGEPSVLLPYALSDLGSDETIYIVRGEANADLVRDGFGRVATTFPSGLDLDLSPSFLHPLQGKDVVILDVGGARSDEFCAAWSSALGVPVTRLPDGVKTLREFARIEGASLDDLSAPHPDPTHPASAPVISPTPFVWCDPSSIPPREWVYDTHLIRKFVSLTVSPGGLGKSSLALVEALSMVTNRALLADATIHEPDLRVWYWNGEDPQEETRRRVMAACKHYGISSDDLGGRLFTDSGRDSPMVLGELTRDGTTLNEDLFSSIEETMIANRIDVFMADPFVSAHRLGENDNNAIDAVIKRLGLMADRTNAAIEIVHHVRKPSTAQAETDVNDARGASALIGGVRSARVLNVMSEDISQAASVPSDLRLRHFSVTDGKANMSPKAAEARWRFLESVCLGNQTADRKADNVGVVTYFKMPEEVKNMVDLSGAEDTMRLILSQDDTVRHWTGRGPKPKNWIVHRIMDDLNIHDQSKEPALHKLVVGWLTDGIIATRTMLDKNNRVTVLTMKTEPFSASSTHEIPDDTPF